MKNDNHFLQLSSHYIDRARENAQRYGHNPHFVRLQNEMSKLRTMGEALKKLHQTPDPKMTEAAHLQKVRKQAERLRAEIAKANERIAAIQQQAVREIEGRIQERAPLRDSPHAAEVRAVLRGMDASDRAKAMRQMLKDEAAPELMGAILNAPSVLTGLPDDLRERYRAEYLESRAPAELAESNDLLTVWADASALTARADQWAELVQGDPDRLAEIDKAEAAAAEAEQALNAAMS